MRLIGLPTMPDNLPVISRMPPEYSTRTGWKTSKAKEVEPQFQFGETILDPITKFGAKAGSILTSRNLLEKDEVSTHYHNIVGKNKRDNTMEQ